MRVIPKFASGGYSLYFTRASASLLPALNVTTAAPAKSSSSSSGSDNNLSEKDFFNMVKDIDGLPNEMRDIIGLLSNIFAYLNITGDSLTDLSSIYLNTLYQVKVAALNKKRYDKTLENAQTNGSMYEPAITSAGGLLVQDENGSLVQIDPRAYLENPNEYIPVTVSLLMNMRAYDPGMAYDKYAFDIANNSVGFEEFNKLIHDAINKLGSTLTSTDYRLPIDPQATIELILQLGEQGISYTQLRETQLDLNSLQQIVHMINYIVKSMPKRVLTWAMIKTNTPDGEVALGKLAWEFLSAGEDIISKTTKYIDFKKGNGTGTGSDLNDDKQKAGDWYSIIEDKAGEKNVDFQLLPGGNGGIIEHARWVGRIPHIDSACSLQEFLTKSEADWVRASLYITFGDLVIADDSYEDIAIDPASGMFIVSLPRDIDGTPNFDIIEEYADALKEINQALRDHPNLMPDFERIIGSRPNLSRYYDPNSNTGWKEDLFSKYAVFLGMAYDKTEVVVPDPNNPGRYVLKTVKDVKPQSHFIEDVDETDRVYRHIRDALNNRHINAGYLSWFPLIGGAIGWGKNELYKGLVYMLLSENLVNAVNADNKDRNRGLIDADSKALQDAQHGAYDYNPLATAESAY